MFAVRTNLIRPTSNLTPWDGNFALTLRINTLEGHSVDVWMQKYTTKSTRTPPSKRKLCSCEIWKTRKYTIFLSVSWLALPIIYWFASEYIFKNVLQHHVFITVYFKNTDSVAGKVDAENIVTSRSTLYLLGNVILILKIGFIASPQNSQHCLRHWKCAVVWVKQLWRKTFKVGWQIESV
jgi:hypothetical protein